MLPPVPLSQRFNTQGWLRLGWDENDFDKALASKLNRVLLGSREFSIWPDGQENGALVRSELTAGCRARCRASEEGLQIRV